MGDPFALPAYPVVFSRKEADTEKHDDNNGNAYMNVLHVMRFALNRKLEIEHGRNTRTDPPNMTGAAFHRNTASTRVTIRPAQNTSCIPVFIGFPVVSSESVHGF
jgi:hypothetical protein